MTTSWIEGWGLVANEFCLRWVITGLHFLWQGAAIGAAVVAIDRIFRTRSASARYALHALALLCLPACVIVTSTIVDVPSALTIASGEPLLVRQAEIMDSEFAHSNERGEASYSLGELELQGKPEIRSESGASLTALGEQSVANGNTNQMPVLLTRVGRSLSPAVPFVATVYLIGAGYFLLRLGFAVRGGHQLRSRAIPVKDPILLKTIVEQSRRLGLRLVPLVAYCEQVAVPTVIGVLRPVVLLPGSLVTGLDPEQFAAIISHELAHIRRFDLLMNLLQRVIESLLFFHPVVWYISRRMSEEREICCDDLVVATGHEPLQYAGALLRMAEVCASARRPGIAALAASGRDKSQLELRIERLINAIDGSRLRMTRTGVAIVSLLVAMLALTPLMLSKWVQAQEEVAPAAESASSPNDSPDPEPIAARPQQEQSAGLNNDTAEDQEDAHGGKHYVTGVVLEETTNKPVAGAQINILVMSELDPDKRLLRGVSDADGTYRIEVPLGDFHLWYPRLKPGYWLPAGEAIKALATSRENPTVVHNLVVKPTVAWPIQVEVEGGVGDAQDWLVSAMEVEDDAKRKATLNGEGVSFDKSPPQAYTNLQPDGSGAITQVGESGKLIVGIGDLKGRSAPLQTELVVEPGFDITRIQHVRPDISGKKVTLVDEAGASATIGKAQVSIKDGLPLLTFRLERSQPSAAHTFSGRVIDITGKPLEGVRIGATLGVEKQGSADTGKSTTTDANGQFTLELDIPTQFRSKPNYLQLVVTKVGYAGFDSQQFSLPKNDAKAVDLADLTLRPGYSLPVRVVNHDGMPLPGARVEPIGNYAQRRQVIRTDENGRGVIQNVPAGVLRVSVHFGSQAAAMKLVISDQAADNVETSIKLDEAHDATPSGADSRPESIAVGSLAPEFSLGEWTDGESRKLSDYRGKVVVLDFWGVWCSPCVMAIPAMQQLADEFEKQGVVFLGIHTPDGDIAQIKKLKKLRAWTTPSAIDRGSTVADGVTSTRYGVRGYPTVIVIDEEGKIAFNSGIMPEDMTAVMQKMQQLAEANQIPWPLDPKSDPEELNRHLTKLNVAMFSEEIDRVLSAAEKKQNSPDSPP